MMLVVLGPDGCGKSTVIDALLAAVQQEFSEVSCHHLHLPIGRRRKNVSGQSVTDPHAKKPYGLLLSVLKLCCLLALYHLGSWLHRGQIGAHGSLIVLDRYYHDLLVDPRRFRYGGPPWLAGFVGRWIPKPHLLVLLDAPVAVLQSRKQEVAPEETRRQCGEYRRLVAAMPFGRILDATRPVAEIVDDIRTALYRLREGGRHAEHGA